MDYIDKICGLFLKTKSLNYSFLFYTYFSIIYTNRTSYAHDTSAKKSIYSVLILIIHELLIVCNDTIKDVRMYSSSTKFRPYHISSKCHYNKLNDKDNIDDLLIQTLCMYAYLCESSQRI